jgi:hypothetical protein
MEPTIVSTSTGSISIAYDYSPYLERIASSLERIAIASTTTGIRHVGPYDWVAPTEIYDWYRQDLSSLISSTATINTLFSNINTITNSLPRFL